MDRGGQRQIVQRTISVEREPSNDAGGILRAKGRGEAQDDGERLYQPHKWRTVKDFAYGVKVLDASCVLQ